MKRFKNFFKYLSTFFIVSLILLIINGCGQQEKQEATQVPAAEKTENKIVTQAPTKEKTASIKKETPAPVPEKTDTIRRAMRAPAKEKIERTIIGARIPKKKKAERPKRIIVLSERPLSKSLDKEQPRATSTAKEDYIPNFPWPPPKASSVAELPNRFFIAEASKQVYLRDIDLRLSSALEDTGYYDKSYYSVPAGFAIVTRLEQIYQDGKPKPLPQRWSVDVGAIQDFSISTYIKALFTSNL